MDEAGGEDVEEDAKKINVDDNKYNKNTMLNHGC